MKQITFVEGELAFVQFDSVGISPYRKKESTRVCLKEMVLSTDFKFSGRSQSSFLVVSQGDQNLQLCAVRYQDLGFIDRIRDIFAFTCSKLIFVEYFLIVICFHSLEPLNLCFMAEQEARVIRDRSWKKSLILH